MKKRSASHARVPALPVPANHSPYFENRVFSDCVVDVDGGEFHNCEFQRATVRYSGGGVPVLMGCSFRETRFEFAGAAECTICFLKAMSSRGSGLQVLVRQTFAAVFGN